VRASGSGDLGAVAAVVLETDGTLSVISRSALGSGDALSGLVADERLCNTEPDAG
jgi:uncharacterized membrane protein YcaP (DUF421 family)